MTIRSPLTIPRKIYNRGHVEFELLTARIRQYRYRLRYGRASPDPYNLIYVDTGDVNRLQTQKPQEEKRLLEQKGAFIRSGTWDTNCSEESLAYANVWEKKFDETTIIPFSNFLFFSSLHNHFQNGVSWDDTEIYNWFLSNFELGINRYRTREQVEQRFQWIDEFYEKIKEEGYQKQTELMDSKYARVPPEHREVILNIGRDGEFFFYEGRHRFTIAKILGITIPVRILLRHKKWQELRHEVAMASRVTDLSPKAKSVLDHPDMEDILTFSIS